MGRKIIQIAVLMMVCTVGAMCQAPAAVTPPTLDNSTLAVPTAQQTELKKALVAVEDAQKALQLAQANFNTTYFRVLYDLSVPKGWLLNVDTWTFSKPKEDGKK